MNIKRNGQALPIALGLLAAIVATGLTALFSRQSIRGSEMRQRNAIEAQQKNLAVVYDNTWKILQQQAGVASEYKDAFAKIYPDLMAGRYGNSRGGALLSMVKESNPTFDIGLYSKLTDSIEVQRTQFTREQQKLIDLKREDDNILTGGFTAWALGDRSPVSIQLVTSARTEKAFETGKDDNVELFHK